MLQNLWPITLHTFPKDFKDDSNTTLVKDQYMPQDEHTLIHVANPYQQLFPAHLLMKVA
jgi:hypothetical protein